MALDRKEEAEAAERLSTGFVVQNQLQFLLLQQRCYGCGIKAHSEAAAVRGPSTLWQWHDAVTVSVARKLTGLCGDGGGQGRQGRSRTSAARVLRTDGERYGSRDVS